MLAPYPVANAVNASSAFPGAFQDVTLQWYMEPMAEYLHLYDGGPIDNLGVQAITQYLNRNVLGTTLDRLFPKGCVIFVIDATPSSDHTELDFKQSSRSAIDYFVDTNPLDAADAMLIESRRSLLERLGIPVEKQDREPRGRLPVNDLRQCSCEVRHISLRHLAYAAESEANEGLAERVTRIKTKFWLAEGEQNDLFQAAKVIMQMLDDKHLLSEPSFKVPCGSGPAQKPPA